MKAKSGSEIDLICHAYTRYIDVSNKITQIGSCVNHVNILKFKFIFLVRGALITQYIPLKVKQIVSLKLNSEK